MKSAMRLPAAVIISLVFESSRSALLRSDEYPSRTNSYLLSSAIRFLSSDLELENIPPPVTSESLLPSRPLVVGYTTEGLSLHLFGLQEVLKPYKILE